MEEKLSLQEFHDLEEVEDGEEDGDYLEEEGEEGEDIEKGLKGNFHYSPSLIQKRGVSTLHQVKFKILSSPGPKPLAPKTLYGGAIE